MITVTMVKKLKDNNGKIYGYIIRDGYGKEAGIQKAKMLFRH